jgi:hypothetical protein
MLSNADGRVPGFAAVAHLDLPQQGLLKVSLGEPVKARLISSPERLWKWACREPGWAALSAGVLVGLTVLAGVREHYAAHLDQAYRSEQEQRRQADENLESALGAIKTFLIKAGEPTLTDEPGVQVLRQGLLENAIPVIQAFIERYEQHPELTRELAAAHFLLGEVDRITGQMGQAGAHLDRALDLRRGLTASDPDGSADFNDLIDSLCALAEVQKKPK